MSDVQLSAFSISSNELERGSDDGIEFSFALSGEGTITVFLIDSFGNRYKESFEGSSGTFTAPLDGTVYQSSSNLFADDVETYAVDMVVVEDRDGQVTTYDGEDIVGFGVSPIIDVTTPTGEGSDSAPPEILNFQLHTSEEDLDGIGQPRFTIEIADDDGSIFNGYIEIGQEGDPDFTSRVYVEEMGGTGVFAILDVANLEFPGASGGYYVKSIVLYDDSGQITEYTKAQLENHGWQTEFSFESPFSGYENASLPELISFEIMTPEVNQSQDVGVIFNLSATGDTYRHVSITLEGENGNLAAFSARITDGVFSHPLDDFNISGTVTIKTLKLYDAFGSYTLYTAADLQSLGFDSGFLITGNPFERVQDTVAPVPVEFKVYDDVVDLDSGDYFIDFRLTVEDETDLFNATAVLRNEETGKHLFLSISGSGDHHNLLGPYVGPGTYSLVRIVMEDWDDNYIVYEADQLEEMGFSESFSVINSREDNEAPDLIGLDIQDSNLNLAQGENQVTFQFEMEDNLSGGLFARIYVQSPNGDYLDGYSNMENGVVTIDLPEDAPTGEYTIFKVHLRDQAIGNFNFADYSTEDLDALGFPTTFTVTNTLPTPALAALSLDTTSVDMDAGEDSVSLSVQATMEDGAVDYINIIFQDPNGYLVTEYVNGSAGTVALELSPYAMAGTYTLYGLEIGTTNGGITRLSASDIEQLLDLDQSSFVVSNTAGVDYGEATFTPESTMQSQGIDPTGDLATDSLLSGSIIASNGNGQTIVTYSFASENSVFTSAYYENASHDNDYNLTGLDGAEQQIVRDLLADISSYTNLIFLEVPDDGTSSAGHLRITWTDGSNPNDGLISSSIGWASYPGAGVSSSDVWLTTWGLGIPASREISGTYLRQVIAHELGHALGLKHPHELDGDFPILSHDLDGLNHTVMSYTSIADQTDDRLALYPQGYMALDIAALQAMYGVNMMQTGGNDTYSIRPGQDYFQTIWDAGGTDHLDARLMTSNVALNLAPGAWSDVGTQVSAPWGTLYLTSTLNISPDAIIENATGGSGDDTLTGNDADNVLKGMAGDDIAYGMAGDDTIWAGAGDTGNDRFFGGDGADMIGGGAGDDLIAGDADSDILYGGSGNDVLLTGSFDDKDANGTFERGESTIFSSATEVAWGGTGDDTIIGTNGSEILGGGAGNDLINGWGGHDLIYGGKGGQTGGTVNDSINGGGGDDTVFAGDGDDRIEAGGGDDIVYNGAGDDTVVGDGGNDTLWGGGGDDVLTGGAGTDTFAFTTTNGTDTVTDFEGAEDILLLENSGFADLATLKAAATENAGGVTISFGDTVILLSGIALDDLTTTNVML